MRQTKTKRETNKDKKIHEEKETERARTGKDEVVSQNKGEAEFGGHGDKGEK